MLMLLVLSGCALISDGDFQARMDLDGDGIARPEDCDDDDARVQAATLVYTDADVDGYGGATGERSCEVADGFSAVGGDCDDTNPDAFPGGVEVCDGADNDCDGTIDGTDATGQLTWYPDADGDTYGVTASAITACDQPAGYTTVPGDCNDADPDINPGEREVCDGRDEDCSGVPDDPYWYQDADSDGYGAASSAIVACSQPDGFVTDYTDCNDARADVNPGAPEVCDDANLDEDCDGLTDDNDPTATATRAAYLDADEDGHGDLTSPIAAACELAPGYSWLDDDCDDARADVNPDADDPCYDALDQDCDGWSDDDCDRDGADIGAGVGEDCDDEDSTISPLLLEVCGDDIDNDCDGEIAGSCAFSGEMSLADAPARVDGTETRTMAGQAVASGDFDGDGQVDFAASFSTNSSFDGGIAVLLGPINGDTDLSTAAFTIDEDTRYELSGPELAAADFDHDGVDDLLVAGTGIAYAGVVGVFYGAAANAALSDADVYATGEPGSYLGYGVSAGGDLNSDGYPDAAFTTQDYYEDGVQQPSTVYFLLGGARGGAAFKAGIQGSAAGYMTAPLVHMDGDLDGDGQAELLVSSNQTIWVFNDATTAASQLDADTTITDSSANTFWSAEIAGDTDADGYDDIVQISCSNSPGHPVANVLLGPATGETNLRNAVSTISLGDNYQSCAASGAGDLDGNGAADLILGNPAEDGYAGEAYVLLGPISGVYGIADMDGVLTGEAASSAGTRVGGLGDINGDGSDDVFVNSSWTDAYYNDSALGTVYLIFGGE